MRFSLLPGNSNLSSDARLRTAGVSRCVEQGVLADELGYHCVWAVEHHGLYEYSHSSAPEMFLAFVAARTKRDPPRPRGHAAAPPLQPPDPHRRAHRDARHPLGRTRELGLGQKLVAHRAAVAFENDRDDAPRAVARGDGDDPAHVGLGRVRVQGQATFRSRRRRSSPSRCRRRIRRCSRRARSPETPSPSASWALGALNFAFGTDEYLAEAVRSTAARSKARSRRARSRAGAPTTISPARRPRSCSTTTARRASTAFAARGSSGRDSARITCRRNR